MPEVGVVVIGRNEGQRLVRCVESLSIGNLAAVYVDSGSTDNSVAVARGQGFDVLELDIISSVSLRPVYHARESAPGNGCF